MQSDWITYQGKRIFFCRFSNLAYDALAKEVKWCDQLISREPEHSVLVLTDISNVVGSPSVITLFKDSTTFTKKYIKKSASIGIGFSGPKKVLFDIVMKFSGQNVVLFNDLEAAKNWLIQA